MCQHGHDLDMAIGQQSYDDFGDGVYIFGQSGLVLHKEIGELFNGVLAS